ncbi:hypothetical protein C900_02413 [Fulvivirga imtechensis AK7]|uniref:HMA domain-containing protein n=1 Tax=Fulvivirga imtechensis AK7 TaxID=1237149 RepID=L8JWU4_9BACT|nr:hypothetical protein [Fulvivirga imtechensis]ELR71677.1 hypothetical protein C900_02413 [Fulvivirga imtechensis AK7]
MKNLKFKTNIKCAACVAKVTPYLNEAVGEDNWKVDVESSEKTLTVVDGDEVEVKQALEKAGYRAEDSESI